MKAPKNILIITYWSYTDALIQTYTLPYARLILKALPAGSKIFLLTLDKNAVSKEQMTGDESIINISVAYQPFGIGGILMWMKTMLKLLGIIRREKISTLHAWCTPAGMIAYILAMLTRRELIIDSYEPHAEAMVENGTWKKDSFAFKLLFRFEKLQSRKAKYLIAAASGMKEYAKEKYNHTKDNMFVKPACVDLDLFSYGNVKNKKLLEELNLVDKIVCVYAGKFGGIYLEDEVFSFFKTAETYWGDRFKVLILSSHSSTEISKLATKAHLKEDTIIHRFVSHHQIPDYMGLADFAITPVKSVPSKRFCSPIKDGEYWALGIPVVITKNISDDSDIIAKSGTGSLLENLNEESYLKSIGEIEKLLKTHSRDELYKKIRPLAEINRNFETAKKTYLSIYGIT